MCSSDPRFGIRIARGDRLLDLTLDRWTLWVEDSDDRRTINELTHDSFFRAIEEAIRGGA